MLFLTTLCTFIVGLGFDFGLHVYFLMVVLCSVLSTSAVDCLETLVDLLYVAWDIKLY